MASTTSLEGVKKAVFFPFQGKNRGTKLVIGWALSFANYFIPLIPTIPLLGYYAQIMRRVIIQDEDPEMPEWKDWGTLFLDGIKVLGVVFIFLIPSILIMVAGYILFFVLEFAYISSLSNTDQYQTTFPPFFFGDLVGMFGGMTVIWIGLLLSFVTLIFLPPALGNMISKNEFGAAFRFKEWWPVFRVNLSGYILAIAIAIGFYSLMAMALMILYFSVLLCILLPFAAGLVVFIFGAIIFSLYAVAYRDGARKLAAQPA